MAKTDQYDRMNTNQLEDEARSRGLDVTAFQQLANNSERAQQLRDHDAARDADAQVAAQNAEQARQAQAAQDQGADQGQATDQVQVQRSNDTSGDASQPGDNQEQIRARSEQNEGDRPTYEQPGRQAGQGDVGPYDTAPYPSDESRQAAIDAASGNLSTDQSIDTGQAPPVGGQAGETPAEQQQRNEEARDQ